MSSITNITIICRFSIYLYLFPFKYISIISTTLVSRHIKTKNIMSRLLFHNLTIFVDPKKKKFVEPNNFARLLKT